MSHPICPSCGGFIPNNDTPGAYPGALSRRDNKTEICSNCGVREALADMVIAACTKASPITEDDEGPTTA